MTATARTGEEAMNTYRPAGPPRFLHQQRGLRDIIRNRGVHALLFDPGTGKTATVLDYASLLALKSPSRFAKVLVVGPLAAMDTWVEQAKVYVADGIEFRAEALGGGIKQKAEVLTARGRGDLKTGLRRSITWHHRDATGPDDAKLMILAVNLDAFSSRRQVGSKTMADVIIDGVLAYAPDLLVVDESHRIKSASANGSRALARLSRHVRRRIILTGTVMPHSPLDVYGQWRFLDPYAFGTPNRPATFGGFRNRFAKMGGWMGKEVLGFKNLDEMQQIMAKRSTVARKEDVLDLPKVTDVPVPVHLSPAEKRAYAEMKRDLQAQLESGALASVPNRLAQMMRLRQITSGYLPDDAGRLTVLGESKAQVVRSIVHDTLAGEKRIVVFAHFRYEIELLQRILREQGTEIVAITGGTPNQERAAIRRRFGSDDPARLVMVAQIRTMSLAVNELVTASHAVFASLPNQRDDIEQARARLDRQGQTKPVTIWTTMVPRTVDEVIWRSYLERTDLEAAMMRHISEQADL